MQTFTLDISHKGVVPLLVIKQRNVGTKILANITDNGKEFTIPEDAVWSVWFSGASGKGNYTSIDGRSAFTVESNTVTVELIIQMLNNPGPGQMSLVMNSMEGDQLGLWNIPYYVECLPGANGSAAENYYAAFHEDVIAARNAAEEAGKASNWAQFYLNGAQTYAENAEHYAGLASDSAATANDAVREVERIAGTALSEKYDLKEGYGYTEDMYIAADGTETALTGKNFKCVDYIPVNGGVTYVMYGCGHALYDATKTFKSATMDTTGTNAIKEFTPEVDGYVRLTINSEDIAYARFCRSSESNKEWQDYLPAPNSFFDHRIPCNVHLYGDSNSEGFGLSDPSLAWSNRLKALIENLPETVYHYRLSGFGSKELDGLNDKKPSIILDSPVSSKAVLTAYTDEFTIYVKKEGFSGVYVFIDGVTQEAMYVGDGVEPGTVEEANEYEWKKTYSADLGIHQLTILCGVASSNNRISCVTTRKYRTFVNHAVTGSVSFQLPDAPDGNIDIVMYGTNDRATHYGTTYSFVWDFYRKCKALGNALYIFTPIPTAIAGETDSAYKQNIGDIISQLPPDSINIYKDLQMIEVLTGETIFSDALHLNERGHELLYAIAASKLGLAALNSEIDVSITGSNDSEFWAEFTNRSQFNYAFAYWTDAMFKPQGIIKPAGTGANDMFYNTYITNVATPLTGTKASLDLSGVTSLYNTFASANITRLPPINASSCKEMTLTFSKAKATEIIIYNIDEGCYFDRVFNGCTALVDLRITGKIGTSKASAINKTITGFDVSTCKNLSKESIEKILNCLVDKTGDGWIITLGTDNLQKVDEMIEDEQLPEVTKENGVYKCKGWTLE